MLEIKRLTLCRAARQSQGEPGANLRVHHIPMKRLTEEGGAAESGFGSWD